MTQLRIFADHAPDAPLQQTADANAIEEQLGRIGVRFERWATRPEIGPQSDPDDVLEAYQPEIQRLMADEGYQSADVVSMHPEHPDKATMRQKFLDEHTHAEDEVRFFVAGRGLFTLHANDQVFEVLCERGDLIGVPANMRHWFDMGPQPSFVAVRVFTSPDGWAADFTGSDIAQQFPRLDA